MTVRTPSTVAGVRGTSFYLDVYSDDSSYFCLCNGELQMTDNTGKNITHLVSNNHKALNFIKRPDGFVRVEEAGLKEHDSAEMEILAEKIGFTIDWTKADQHPNN
jgi:hypothetical protein